LVFCSIALVNSGLVGSGTAGALNWAGMGEKSKPGAVGERCRCRLIIPGWTTSTNPSPSASVRNSGVLLQFQL
jgi:hypothetical protein